MLLTPSLPPLPSFHKFPTPEWVNSWTWLGLGPSAITYQLPELLLSHLRSLCPLRTRDSCHMHCTELMSRKMLLSTPWAPSWVAVFLSISFSSGNFSRWACSPDPRLLLLPPALSVNKLTVHPAWVCYAALVSGFPGFLQDCGSHCPGIPMVHPQQPHSLGVKVLSCSAIVFPGPLQAT